MATPPLAWTQLVTAHRRAQVAHDALHDRALPQVERDRQTVVFGQSLDEMFHALNRLSEAGVTGRIGLMLSRTGGLG